MIDIFLGKKVYCGLGWSLRVCTPDELFRLRLIYAGILLIYISFFVMTGILIHRRSIKAKSSKLFYIIYIVVAALSIFFGYQEIDLYTNPKLNY